MCEWVSESVCHTKPVERSTDRSLPPIFTKLVRCGYVLFLVEVQNIISAKPQVELILTIAPVEKYL